MKNNSSNNDMEKIFSQLANIQQVNPSEGLFESTIARIKKPQIISIFWVRTVAAMLILFCLFELILVKNEFEKNENAYNQLNILLPQSQNILYND